MEILRAGGEECPPWAAGKHRARIEQLMPARVYAGQQDSGQGSPCSTRCWPRRPRGFSLEDLGSPRQSPSRTWKAELGGDCQWNPTGSRSGQQSSYSRLFCADCTHPQKVPHSVESESCQLLHTQDSRLCHRPLGTEGVATLNACQSSSETSRRLWLQLHRGNTATTARSGAGGGVLPTTSLHTWCPL